MRSKAESAALRPDLLLASFLLGLAPPALAAPAPTHPALAVERWTAVYTVVISRSGPVAAPPGTTGSGTVNHSSSGRATLSRTGPNSWEGRGSIQGTATESVTLKGKDGTVEEKLSGNGSGTGFGQLGVHARQGTWDFHFPTITFPTTDHVTTTVGGRTITQTSRGSLLIECPSLDRKVPPLPAGTGLTNTFRGKVLAGRSMAGGPGTYVCTVELYPAGQAPKPGAEAGGPYRVERGAKVTLDGSRSKGSVREYAWTVSAPSCGGGQAAPRTLRHQGATWSFVALCDLEAKLTVTDANEVTSTDTARVQVQPRQPPAWSTPFEHVAGERLDGMKPSAGTCKEMQALFGITCTDPMAATAVFVGGANVCARGDADAETHIIHPEIGKRSGDGQAYRVAAVADPGGPFDGWFYVDEYRAEVRRQTVVGSHILPTSSFYRDNAAQGNDVAGYAEAVRMHEGLGGRGFPGHSLLMKQGLDARDPAREVEEIVSADRTTVVRKADQALRDAERRLCERAKDPLPKSWSGDLRVETKRSTFIAGPTQVGGEGYNGKSPCN